MPGLPFTPDIGTSPIGEALSGFTRGAARAREETESRRARAGQILLEAAKTDPDLFDDPQASKSIMAYIGDKDAFEVVKGMYQAQAQAGARVPYEQAQALGAVTPEDAQRVAGLEGQARAARAANAQGAPAMNPIASIARGVIGQVPIVGPTAANVLLPLPAAPPRVPVPQPYAVFKEKVVRAGRTTPGATVRMGAKGETTVGLTGPTRSEFSELTFYQAAEARRRELEAEGLPEVQAHLTALREATDAADREGLLVPKEARKLSDAKTQQQVTVALKRATREAEKAIDRATARGISRETEIGQRQARTTVPISEDEQIAVMAEDMARRHNLTPEQAAGVAADIREGLSARRVGAEATSREVGTAKGRLAPEAPQPTPADARTRLTASQNAMDALSTVQELFDPKVVGPLAGRVTNIRGIIGALSIPEERFRAAIDNFVRAERLATTGQGASVEELSRMKKELLNLNQAPQQFFARVVEMARGTRNIHENMSNVLRANNEVTVPLDVGAGLQQWLAQVETPPQAGEQVQTPTAGGLPEGWTIEQVQ